MPDDRFEDRLRALARQISRSISESDLDDVAARLGFDDKRSTGAARALEGWLTDRASVAETLFGESRDRPPNAERVVSGPAPHSSGPHPLDLPSDEQGRALSALGSGRWTVRPGSGRLASVSPAGDPPEPPGNADLIGELCARDWITADGTVTLVGRHALIRWCHTVEPSGRVVAGDDDADRF